MNNNELIKETVDKYCMLHNATAEWLPSVHNVVDSNIDLLVKLLNEHCRNRKFALREKFINRNTLGAVAYWNANMDVMADIIKVASFIQNKTKDMEDNLKDIIECEKELNLRGIRIIDRICFSMGGGLNGKGFEDLDKYYEDHYTKDSDLPL